MTVNFTQKLSVLDKLHSEKFCKNYFFKKFYGERPSAIFEPLLYLLT